MKIKVISPLPQVYLPVSACLLGLNTKYSGSNNFSASLFCLIEKGYFIPIPFCPEQLGGLCTPREKSEICGKQVVSESGKKIVAEIEGTNYTSFLFGVLPIVSGSHTRPNAWQYSMWRDNVSNRKTRSMMNWYATRVMKADGIENFEVEYDTIGWPTLWIVTWKTAHAKAQVVKNIPAKKTK